MLFAENSNTFSKYVTIFLLITFIPLAKGPKFKDYDFKSRKAGLVALPSIKFRYNELYEDIMEPKYVATFVDFTGERPPNMFLGGHDCDHNPYYIGRTVHLGRMVVGRVAEGDVLYIGYEGKGYPKLEFQVLVNGTSAGAKWSPAPKGIQLGTIKPFLGGRWGRKGERTDRQPIFVCRAIVDCHLIPGYALINNEDELVCVVTTDNQCFEQKQFDVILNHKAY